jgi:hypothetical protein
MIAVGAAGVTLPAVRMLADRAGLRRAYARPTILSLLGDDRHLREIGAAYRQAFPAEATVDALVAALDARSGADLDARVCADFDHGRTVVIRGWVLSVTEARQCALHSLLHA